MIREISQRHLKIKQRDKSRTSSHVSQNKTKKEVSRQSKGQTAIHRHPIPQPQLPKSSSTAKISKEQSQTVKNKPNNNHKNQEESNAIYMKGNLKQLMSKHTGGKVKNSEVVPDLLKNIEKHCKELKKIHEKEKNFYDKRISLQQNKAQKEKKTFGGNKSQEHHHKKKKESRKEATHKEEIVHPADNRFSLQISSKDRKQEDKDLFMNERLCKNSVEKAQDEKNFFELFKIYKKNFEVEELKIQKSNKNTNYNTNQSKNSSSLFSSALGDHNNRNKMKPQCKINMEKIQYLIKSQQRSFSRENNGSNSKNAEGKVSLEISKFNGNEDKEVKVQQKVIEMIEANSSLVIHEEDKVGVFEPVNFQEKIAEEMISSQMSKGQQGGEIIAKDSKESSAAKSREMSHEKQVLEKKFESSKFYVQPIPKFKARSEKKGDKDEDSLVGCQITLIENNIICEDSELMELQL